MTYKRKRKDRKREDGRRWKTRNRSKDIDEVDEDLKPDNFKKLLNQEVDLDLPGNAQFYCVHCSRYFIDNKALTDHFRTKPHKRRLKDLETEPYTVEESERAAGKGSYVPPKKRKIETQPTNNMDDDADSKIEIKEE